MVVGRVIEYSDVLERDPPRDEGEAIGEAVSGELIDAVSEGGGRGDDRGACGRDLIQLLPFDIGFHPALYGSFIRMGFPKPNPDLVWVENLTNSVCFEAAADVERYTEVFDHLRATALGQPETRSRIKDMIEEL